MVLWNFFSSPSKGTKEITLTACTLANINKQRNINFQHVLTSKSRNLIMRWSQNMQVIVENISWNQREIQMTDLINRSGWDNNTRWCTCRFSLRLYSIGGKPLNCMYSLKWSCNYLCVITSISWPYQISSSLNSIILDRQNSWIKWHYNSYLGTRFSGRRCVLREEWTDL